MDLTIRMSKDNKWCCVESFNVYRYLDTGSISVTVGISPEGKMVSPYVLRDEMFIPLKVIDEEMGIDKYIKAKKPFYSALAEGFIVSIKAGVNFVTGELIPEKTTYSVYSISSRGEVVSNTSTLKLKRVLEIPDSVNDLMMKIAGEIASCKGNREVFLRNRLG